ncbi:MAG TPA: DNA repair protein RecO [Acidimicrobiia bacterium]
MPGLYRDQGVVLRTVKLGEADRIVTFLTQGNGKVRAVAKGVRKSGSRFGARLEPASHVAMQCYRGRELDVVTQIETIDALRPLRENYACITHAVSMLEAMDQVAQDREPAPSLYLLLVRALRTLSLAPSPVVTPGFFWRLLSLEGFHPELETCVRCGDGGPFPAFELGEGGVLCAGCGRLAGHRIEPEALQLLTMLVGGELRRAIAEPPDARIVYEVERLGVQALEYHSERRLRSAALL